MATGSQGFASVKPPCIWSPSQTIGVRQPSRPRNFGQKRLP
jgi:hypothetical protein